jgi:hypothetical protein
MSGEMRIIMELGMMWREMDMEAFRWKRARCSRVTKKTKNERKTQHS